MGAPQISSISFTRPAGYRVLQLLEILRPSPEPMRSKCYDTAQLLFWANEASGVDDCRLRSQWWLPESRPTSKPSSNSVSMAKLSTRLLTSAEHHARRACRTSLAPSSSSTQRQRKLEDIPPAAAKTGALGNLRHCRSHRRAAAQFTFPLVVDPGHAQQGYRRAACFRRRATGHRSKNCFRSRR